MKLFRKRYLILAAGLLAWCFYPCRISFSLTLLLTGVVYAVFSNFQKHLNPVTAKENDLSKYLEVRESLKTGDVIAFGGTDLFARIIRASSHSAYSHVGMVVRFDQVRDAGGRVFILESVTQKGVVLLPLSAKLLTYDGTGADWYPLATAPQLENGAREKIFEYLMAQLGKSYDYRDIQMIVKKIIFKIKNLDKFMEDSTRMICSELVANALKQAGVYEFKNSSLIAPGEIVKLSVFAPAIKVL